MDIGLTLLTHGVMTRDHDGDCFLQNISPEDMAPVESAVRAEALGFHSVWFSDHVVTERVTGRRARAACSSRAPCASFRLPLLRSGEPLTLRS